MEGLFGDATFWVGVGLLLFLAVAFYNGAFSTLTKILDDRAAAIKAELEEAQRLRQEAQALLTQYQQRQRDAEREAEEIVAQAKLDAERMASEARQQLAQLIERRTAMAEQKIAQAESEAMTDVRAAATAAAIAATQQLLMQRVTPERGVALANAAIAELRGKLH